MNSLPILTHNYVLVTPTKPPLSNLSVPEFIYKNTAEYGDMKAMINSLTEESATYNDIKTDAVKVAEGLKKKGIKPGDVVAVCSENRLEYAPVVLGILSTGAACNLLNPMYNIDELVHVLSISRPDIVFCSNFTAKKIRTCQLQMPFIKELIMLGGIGSIGGFSSYEELLDNPAQFETFQFPKLDVREAVAFLLCSSGTTGLPKCVELTHSNITYMLTILRNMEVEEKTVILGLIPFFHGYGLTLLLVCLLRQALNVVMMKFDEVNFLRSIEKYKVTNLYLVPPLVVFLSKHPLVTKYDLSSVRKIICGAAPLSKETQLAAQKRLNLKLDIQQAYGMTELSVTCVMFQGEFRKTGASGTILPGMECKVVDLNTKKALPPYERGELCFRGPLVMKGYRNNPEATREVFDADGWFHTGDIGYYDKEGFLFIVDRLKELIKYKAYQVPPAELETILINHPQIKEAGVIGIPDEDAGELPLAFVVLQPGAKLTEKEIQNYVAGKVSPQKRLHGGVRFLNEIPKNPSGKILRKELRLLVNKSKL